MLNKYRQLVAALTLLCVASLSYAIMPVNGVVSQGTQAVGVIVKMRNDTTPLPIAKAGGQPRLSTQTVAVMSVVAGATLTYKRTASQGAHVLTFTQAMPVADAQDVAGRLMTMADVEYATPNLIIKPLQTVNDPDFPNQWALNDPTTGANLPAAWDITQGNISVPIAVIDTGYTNHSDLVDSNTLLYSNFATDGYDFITDPTAAGDGNGRDGDARDEGDYCATDVIPKSSWHSTAVMSIIGAITNNNSLMAGINWRAKMIPVRVLGRCGGQASDLIDAIRWAAGLHVNGVPDNQNPAKVINMSLGATGACDSFTQAAINDAHAAGAVIIVAAGNETLPASTSYPANCDHVMAIAAHDQNGNISYFSNYGSTVALSAPGENIEIATCSSTTTYNCDNSVAVASESGTSLSAPMVSGVASLLFALDGTLSNIYLEEILRNSARAFVSNSTCTGICGTGMLDAANAVTLVNNSLSPTSQFVAPATQVELSKDSGGAVVLEFWLGLALLVLLYRRLSQRAVHAVSRN